MVLSSMLHTRRVHYVFTRLFKENGIRLLVKGADALYYSEKLWWESEDGMLMINNEYTKMIYYFFKYGLPISEKSKQKLK